MSAEQEMNDLEVEETERVRSYRDDRLTDLASYIWGPSVPTFTGSPHEGDPINGFEVVLHELCHHVMLPARYVFSPGRMVSAHDIVTGYIDKLNPRLPRRPRALHRGH